MIGTLQGKLINCSYELGFRSAFNQTIPFEIKLVDDIYLTSPIDIINKSNIKIDLGVYKIKKASNFVGDYAIKFTNCQNIELPYGNFNKSLTKEFEFENDVLQFPTLAFIQDEKISTVKFTYRFGSNIPNLRDYKLGSLNDLAVAGLNINTISQDRSKWFLNINFATIFTSNFHWDFKFAGVDNIFLDTTNKKLNIFSVETVDSMFGGTQYKTQINPPSNVIYINENGDIILDYLYAGDLNTTNRGIYVEIIIPYTL